MLQLVESCSIFFYITLQISINLFCIIFDLPYLCIMRVLIINTSEKTGGAAVAANRLMDALNNNGVKAKMLVRDKITDDITVVGLNCSMKTQFHFLWERWCIFWHLHFSKDHLWEIDLANSGNDITSLPEFQEADVIHLSWINQGMLSFSGIRKILKSGKPIVWTMHDLWNATGICHYSRKCKRYASGCGQCPLLPGGGSKKDISAQVFKNKQNLYKDANIHFVACSRWLQDEAKNSALLVGRHLTNIPNPIDTRIYCQHDKKEARLYAGLPEDKRIILFVSQKVTDERKGMEYFVEAMNILVKNDPSYKDNTCIAILGGHSEDVADRLPLPVYPLGFVNDDKKIVCVYNSADVFVLPSLEDNLPNTIMEAMACGVPCVGFKTGGIPEMIEHQKSGYVAQYMKSDDLAQGIHWILDEADAEQLSKNCQKKVVQTYSQHAVAMRYIEVYNQALAFKNYNI